MVPIGSLLVLQVRIDKVENRFVATQLVGFLAETMPFVIEQDVLARHTVLLFGYTATRMWRFWATETVADINSATNTASFNQCFPIASPLLALNKAFLKAVSKPMWLDSPSRFGARKTTQRVVPLMAYQVLKCLLRSILTDNSQLTKHGRPTNGNL